MHGTPVFSGQQLLGQPFSICLIHGRTTSALRPELSRDGRQCTLAVVYHLLRQGFRLFHNHACQQGENWSGIWSAPCSSDQRVKLTPRSKTQTFPSIFLRDQFLRNWSRNFISLYYHNYPGKLSSFTFFSVREVKRTFVQSNATDGLDQAVPLFWVSKQWSLGSSGKWPRVGWEIGCTLSHGDILQCSKWQREVLRCVEREQQSLGEQGKDQGGVGRLCSWPKCSFRSVDMRTRLSSSGLAIRRLDTFCSQCMASQLGREPTRKSSIKKLM